MIKRVKYIGPEMVTLEKGKIYDVIEIDHGLFRIMSELEDDYLFPPELFEIVDDCAPGKEVSGHE